MHMTNAIETILSNRPDESAETVSFMYNGKPFRAFYRDCQPESSGNGNRHAGNPDLITVYCQIRQGWRSLYWMDIEISA
jgi:hypothetical protein